MFAQVDDRATTLLQELQHLVVRGDRGESSEAIEAYLLELIKADRAKDPPLSDTDEDPEGELAFDELSETERDQFPDLKKQQQEKRMRHAVAFREQQANKLMETTAKKPKATAKAKVRWGVLSATQCVAHHPRLLLYINNVHLGGVRQTTPPSVVQL